ncbi:MULTISPECIES: hypothetical protein [unclassified Agreia]|uniref:hypothetical protein n=1 Tax=unclassified Agreia TaxID=2641148 RepID=UPI0006FF75FA|nr:MULTISPECIES: hypothetical protein [unclassified Agreia]KQM59281.1 hypothetical protein ASE64_07750 [Agreia sp. Leaf210]
MVYLNATSGSLPDALDLYNWNAEVAASCLRDLGHFEVLIRNRYSDVLNAHFPDWASPGSALWGRQAGIPLTREKQRKLNAGSSSSVRAARAKTTPPTAGHTIANLTFGFWMMLTASVRVDTIWTPMLSGIFPGRSRGYVHDRMQKLNDFRNRLAHWEPVFSTTTGLAFRLQEFDQFFSEVDPDVAAWVGTQSTVVDAVKRCPVSSLNIVAPTYLGTNP